MRFATAIFLPAPREADEITPAEAWAAGRRDAEAGRPSEEDSYPDPQAYRDGYLADLAPAEEH